MMMKLIICLRVWDFMQYVSRKGETGAGTSPHSQRHSLPCVKVQESESNRTRVFPAGTQELLNM